MAYTEKVLRTILSCQLGALYGVSFDKIVRYGYLNLLKQAAMEADAPLRQESAQEQRLKRRNTYPNQKGC